MRPIRAKRSKQDLENLLSAAELELGIRLSIQDSHAILRLPDGSPLISPNRMSYGHLSICAPAGSVQCAEDCILSIEHRAAKEYRPFVFSCWKQLIRLVIPIRSYGDYLGAMTAGVWQPEVYDTEEWGEEELSGWKARTSVLPVFDPGRMERLGMILDGLSVSISATWEESLPEAGLNMEAIEIQRFLRSNYWYPVKLQQLADHLGVSASHASHQVTAYFGTNFRELVRNERLAAAELLLQQTDLRVGDIAGLVGIGDEQHFNRLFKKVKGISPGRFRRGDR